MGRKQKPWPPALLQLWVAEVNGGKARAAARGLPLTTSRQFCWQAACGQQRHYRIMQPRAALRAIERDGSLRCPICEALQSELSRHVPPVQAAATASQQLWVPEVRCLLGRFSPADIWLPRLRLALQIDGAGHQFVQVHSKTLAQQQRTDWLFDNETVRQGQRALRLHYRDTADSQAVQRVLAAAVALCQWLPAFVMYSPSYGRPVKTAVDAEYWEEVGSSDGGGTSGTGGGG